MAIFKKRTLALVMALVMALSLLQVSALAVEGTPGDPSFTTGDDFLTAAQPADFGASDESDAAGDGSILVTVWDNNEKNGKDTAPIAGADVTLTQKHGGTFTGLTDENGQFLFKNLAAGRYNAKAAYNGQPSNASGRLDVMAGGITETDLFINLKDQGGDPGPSAPQQVYVYVETAGLDGQGTVNDHGYFTVGEMTLEGLPSAAADYQKEGSYNGLSDYQTEVERQLGESLVRFGANGWLDLSGVEWTTLHCAAGADDYVDSGWCWHLDGKLAPKPVYTVQYHWNDGTDATEASAGEYLADEPFSDSIPTNIPVRENYEFLGWSAEQGAAVPTEFPGLPANLADTSGVVHLYGVWRETAPEPTAQAAWFFVLKNNTIPMENGSTGYGNNLYYPAHAQKGESIDAMLKGTVSGEKAYTSHQGVVSGDGTINGVELADAFASVGGAILTAPTDEMIAASVPGFDPATQAVAWYVVKTMYCGETGCPGWHVDGVIYDRAGTAPFFATVNYFSNNGGATAPFAAQTNTVGSTVNLYDGTAVPDTQRPAGMSFTGWNTRADGSGDAYAAGDALPLTGDMTLYAQWTPDTVPTHDYTVNYAYQYRLDGGGWQDVTVLPEGVPTTASLSAASAPSADAVSAALADSYAFEAAGLTGSKTYLKGEVVSGGGDFETGTLTFTVTYRCDDVTPAGTESVRYQFNYKLNGGAEWTSGGYGDPFELALDAGGSTPERIWNAVKAQQPGTGISHEGGTYFLADTYGKNEVRRVVFEDGELYNVVQVYGESRYTVGSLLIAKAWTGDLPEADRPSFTLTVEGPNGYSEVLTSDQLKTSITLKNLAPGQYTITESDAGVTGYTWTAASNQAFKNAESDAVFTATVNAQAAAATVKITNDYRARTYDVNFVVEGSGWLKENTNGAPVEYTWAKFEEGPEGRKAVSYGWSQKAVGSGDGVSKTVTYHVPYAVFAAGGVDPLSVPTVTTAPGYTCDNQFLNNGAAYLDLKSAMDAILTGGEESITYTAACEAGTVNYTVEYLYQTGDGGTYLSAASTTRSAVVGETVYLTGADKTADLTAAGILPGAGYVFNDAKSVSSAKPEADGTTTLTVSFDWTLPVAYRYAAASGTLPAAISTASGDYAVTDGAVYRCGDATENRAAAQYPVGTAYSAATGVWTLIGWSGNHNDAMAADAAYTGVWQYTANGEATARVQFVDESGAILTSSAFSATAPIGSGYDHSAAEALTALEANGCTYTFEKDYVGAFAAGKADETVSYAGSIPADGLVLTRVYRMDTESMVLYKTFSNVDRLPDSFTLTVTDRGSSAVVATLNQANRSTELDALRQLGWTVELPAGRDYRVTESGFSNGANWSVALTAFAGTYNGAALPVESYGVDLTGETVWLRNTYTAVDLGDPDDDNDEPAANLPEEDVPLADLPEEEVPLADLPEEETTLTDLPEEEVPLAEAPATGDSLLRWSVAAGVSGTALVWLALRGKKREDGTV